jgi:hypothetical protein
MTRRRTFIKKSAASLAAATFGNFAFPEQTDIKSTDFLKSDNDEFWKTVRARFPLTDERIYLNNGTIGPSPYPVLQAVREKRVYAMGMYYDAYSDWPDIILNSAVVNWSQALYELFANVKKGQKLEGKKYIFDLNYSKVLNIGTYHSRVPDAVKKEVSALMEKLKSGEIKP